MKTYKQIDFWGSIILIVGFAVASIVMLDQTFIIGYFAVGLWQLTSIIVHEKNHWFIKADGKRKFYHKLVFTVILATIAAFSLCVISVALGYMLLLVILVPMLLFSPLFAIYYTTICYDELYVAIPKRELAHLK